MRDGLRAQETTGEPTSGEDVRAHLPPCQESTETDWRRFSEGSQRTSDTSSRNYQRRELVDDTEIPLAVSPSDVKEHVLEHDGTVPCWGKATERFSRRLQADSPHEARFTGTWAKQARARLLRADEQMRNWTQCTVLFTFTGGPFLTPDASRPMPPSSFVEALTASRSARRSALRGVLNDVGGRWVTMRVVGAHQTGYPHEHVLLGVESEVSSEHFAPVVTAHIENSPIAKSESHGAGAISTEPEPNRSNLTGGVRYITPDLPGVKSVLDADGTGNRPEGVVAEANHRIRTAAVLEATGIEAWRVDASGGVCKSWHIKGS